MMEYLKLDPVRNLKPRARALGWRSMRIFELLLDISATYDLKGNVSKNYLDPDWLAAQWGMSDAEANQLGYGRARDLVEMWLAAFLSANETLRDDAIAIEDPEGGIVIVGWDDFYGPRKTSTERVRRHRGVEPAEDNDASAKALMDLWNEVADPTLSRVRQLAGERMRLARARANEKTLDQWRVLIQKVNSIPGLLGKAQGSKWKADFDWFIKPLSVSKLEEGVYDNWGRGQSAAPVLKAVRGDEELY